MPQHQIAVFVFAGIGVTVGLAFIGYALVRDDVGAQSFRWSELFASRRSMKTTSRTVLLIEGAFMLVLTAFFLAYHLGS